MTQPRPPRPRPALSADAVLGMLGGGMALAATTFGGYMVVHGPAASFGTSKDFTVFAQLAGHRPVEPAGRARLTDDPRALDMTATASIPDAKAGVARARDPIMHQAVVTYASADAAELSIEGRLERVRIGDKPDGLGEILAIEPGPRPTVRTSLGLILPEAISR